MGGAFVWESLLYGLVLYGVGFVREALLYETRFVSGYRFSDTVDPRNGCPFRGWTSHRHFSSKP